MGICCEAEQSTASLVSEGRDVRKIKRAGFTRKGDTIIDGNWLSSFAGRVYSAIIKLHQNPKSFINTLDRVYEDLVTQYVSAPKEMVQLKSMLRTAAEQRPGPKKNPNLTMQALEKTT